MLARRGVLLLLAPLVVALLSGQRDLTKAAWRLVRAQAEPAGQTLPFADVTGAAGLADNRRGRDLAIGQAWGDYDGDGWLDLYVTDSEGSNLLYRNNGDGSFSLSPSATQVGLTETYSSGAVFADYDNDGWRDLYVLNWGANSLFHNEAGLGFRDVTATAGVGDAGNGRTAAWGDYDNDGWLDLYVANWSCAPRCGRPATSDSDRLYHNSGDGTFTDVTPLLPGDKTAGAAAVASFVDYDGDGDLDIYLVSDIFANPVGNGLWRNDGPGCLHWCFAEVAAEASADTRQVGMGLATADYDNDGDLDFYFSNAGPMTLLQNQGDGTFSDAAEKAGVATPLSAGWGSVFLDYDNDGWQDLYLAVTAGSDGGSPANRLFHNGGNGTFSDVSEVSGASDEGNSLGVAYADYDRDGRLDLIVGNHDEQYHLYHNESDVARQNRWLALELAGSGPINRDAVGARVYLTTGDGRVQRQDVVNGSSLGAGNDLTLHFGLGQAAVSQLEILWPNGVRQRFPWVPADRRYRLAYPATAADLAFHYFTFYRSLARPLLVLAMAGMIGLAAFFLWRRAV